MFAELPAHNGLTRNEGVQLVRRLRPAAILQAVFTVAELRAFGRINAPQANSRAVNFERVAVNHAGLSGNVGGMRGRCEHDDA